MQPSEILNRTAAAAAELLQPRRLRLITAGMGAVALAGTLATATAAPTFSPDAQPTGWVSRPTLTSFNLKSGAEVFFRAEFRAGEWSGALFANHIDATGNIAGSSPWTANNAASLLDAQHWDTGRRIVTRNAAGTAVPFRWASLSASQQTALGTATTGPQVLNYVRGERAHEDPNGNKWRARATVLGAIQHSTLLHWKHSDGSRRLYVGANDGMLHAFDAATGAEVFAYIPSMLVSRLPLLRNKPYVHTLYVDGGLAIADVAIGGSPKTLLAGALGGGGRGLFMLDLSDPSAASEAAAAGKIKWEITNAAPFGNLGYTYASPKFARLNDGSAAVVVGNGYLSTTGCASLMIINADTGALIRELVTPGVCSAANPNGLSTATLVDTNFDGKADFAYAGDIDGNLWKFDLSAAASGSWNVTKLATTSPAQAITVPPVVAPHPAGGRMVMVGTGRMLTAADKTDTAVHHVYGFWDGAPVANTTLLTQTLTETTSGTRKVRYASVNVPNWTSGGHAGWRVALPAGERLTGEAPFFNDDRFYFTSTNPTVPAAAEGKPSGMSWLHELNFLTGGNVAKSIYDLNDDGAINDNDKVGGEVIIARQLGAGVMSQPVLVDLASRSLTLYNWVSDMTFDLPSSTPTDSGVSGGHFDVDIYYSTAKSGFAKVKHTHEYDDKYDVTGVNFLNASDPGFNLSNAITDPALPFKVLVVNQYLNPAASVSVGGSAFVPVRTYAGIPSATDPAALLASLPTYNRGNVNTLAFKLPLDAFKTKDWWGDGGIQRVGLMPTQTGCVNKVLTGGGSETPGLNGELRNGALTFQLIKPDTPASALELNWPAGGPKYGWRVKAGATYSNVLTEYTVFWHHPNGKCYGAAGWVPNPPQDTSAGATNGASNRAAGSADPAEGTYSVSTVPPTVTVSSVSTTISGNTTTITTTYSDGKKATTTITVNGDGTETVTIVDRDGKTSTLTRTVGGDAIRGAEETLLGSRRINWREVVRN